MPSQSPDQAALEASILKVAEVFYKTLLDNADEATISAGEKMGMEISADVKRKAIRIAYCRRGLELEALYEPQVKQCTGQPTTAQHLSTTGTSVINESMIVIEQKGKKRERKVAANKDSQIAKVVAESGESQQRILSMEETDAMKREHHKKTEAERRENLRVIHFKFKEGADVNALVVKALDYVQKMWIKEPGNPVSWIQRLFSKTNWVDKQIVKSRRSINDVMKTDSETSVDRLKSKFDAIDELQQTLVGEPELLIRYVDFAMEVDGHEGTAGATANQIAETIGKASGTISGYLALGRNIIQFCYAVSPRSLIGIVVLCMMGFSAHDLRDMSQDQRVALVTILCPSLGDETGSRSRLVPDHIADRVDVLIEIIRFLERVIVYNLVNCQEKLHPLVKARFVAPSQKDSLNFGLRSNRDGNEKSVIYMEVDSPAKLQGGTTETKTGLLAIFKGSIRIDPVAHSNSYQAPTKEYYKKILNYQKAANLNPTLPRFGNKARREQYRALLPDGFPELTHSQQVRIIAQVAFWVGGAPRDLSLIQSNFNPIKDVLSEESINTVAAEEVRSLIPELAHRLEPSLEVKEKAVRMIISGPTFRQTLEMGGIVPTPAKDGQKRDTESVISSSSEVTPKQVKTSSGTEKVGASSSSTSICGAPRQPKKRVAASGGSTSYSNESTNSNENRSSKEPKKKKVKTSCSS